MRELLKMERKYDLLFVVISASILIFCGCVFLWNSLTEHYYLDFQWFGDLSEWPFLIALIVAYVVCVFVDNTSQIKSIFKSVVMLYLSIMLLELANSAVLTTPFPTHDHAIHHADQLLGFHLLPLMHFVLSHDCVRSVVWFFYYSIFIFIHWFPIVLASMEEVRLIYHYFLSFLLSILFGYLICYFYPTMTSPAAVYPSYLFTPFQLNTMHQFQLEHLHQKIKFDLVGGVVSFPSFHVIWACLAIYFISIVSPKLQVAALVYGIIIFLTAVATGWHYFSDVLSGAVVAMIAIQLSTITLDRMEKR